MRAYRHVAVVSQAQSGKRASMFLRLLALPCLCTLAACAIEPREVANQLMLPGYKLQNSAENEAYNRRRGAVEFFVKDNHPRIMSDIARGQGAYLDEAITLAQVPMAAREALKLELRGDRTLYANSPAASVTVLMGYGA